VAKIKDAERSRIEKGRPEKDLKFFMIALFKILVVTD